MAWALHNAGQRFEMHDFATTVERQSFKTELADAPWASNMTRHIGRCDDFAPLVGGFEGRHLYVCGPFAMIDAVLDAARAMGWPSQYLHFERFAAPAPSRDTGKVPEPPPNTAFEVELASTGLRIAVAADQTVCAALADAGVVIPVSCEQGVCGSCLTRVLGGIPEHRDWLLSAAEQGAGGVFTPCCSRSKTPLLVLDL
jgi:vanillate O-demethylase ferredoxin subunit